MKNAASSAKRFETVEGLTIAVFEQSLEDDIWTLFVGFPRDNIVLVATNRNYLHSVLKRIGGTKGPRALPDTLPEWKYVDTHAPTWGLRHYQKNGFASDPTSPFLEGAAANVPDNAAIGVTFAFEPASRRTVNVTYPSSNPNASQILQDHFNFGDAKPGSPNEFLLRLRQPAPSVIEGSVVLAKTVTFYRLLFGLTAMLGHAVYM